MPARDVQARGPLALLCLAGPPTLARVAQEAATPAAPGLLDPTLMDLPGDGRPVEVDIAFHLLDVQLIDDSRETIEFSGILRLAWTDARQGFDPAREGVAEKLYHGDFQFNELAPAWYPQVVLVNASGVPESQGVLLRVQPDGRCTLVQTIHAVARSRMDMVRYPFDRQSLEIALAVLGFDSGSVRLALDPIGATVATEGIQVPQWDFLAFSAGVRSLAAPHVGGTGLASALVLTIEARRQSFFMVRLVLLPLLAIVMLSWSVFWMDRSSLGDRMSVSFVGILTAVAYQIMVGDRMPDIAYVTFMNASLSLSFLAMCASVVVNLHVGACDKRGQSERGDRVDRRCRWLFPVAYALLLLGAALVTEVIP